MRLAGYTVQLVLPRLTITRARLDWRCPNCHHWTELTSNGRCPRCRTPLVRRGA